MITLFYAGLCALLVLILAARVVRWRMAHKIGLGDGGDAELLRRMTSIPPGLCSSLSSALR